MAGCGKEPQHIMPWQLSSARELQIHAAEWDALQRATTDTPFLESAFLLPLLDAFGTGREVLALRRGAKGLEAAALLQPAARRGAWMTFQPSQLPLGPWVAPPSADLVADMRGLMQALPGVPLLLGLTQVDPRLHPRPQDSGSLRVQDYIRTSYIDIAGGFEAYWESRGKNLRQNTRKQRSKLEAEGTAITLECLDRPEQVDAAMCDYGELETKGWKAGTGTAIAPDNAQGRFYGAMLRSFCALGRGRIYRYRFGDRVVAMDLCIDNGELVVILKTAYDESFRNLSPSTLMRHDEFQSWWTEGRYRRIEFYGKTMEWHTRWTDQDRALYHCSAYRWPLLRRLHERLRIATSRESAGNPTQPESSATSQ